MDVWKCFTTAHTALSVTTISMMWQLKLFATCWALCKCSGTTRPQDFTSSLLLKFNGEEGLQHFSEIKALSHESSVVALYEQ